MKRITINLADDALLLAQHVAMRDGTSLHDAVPTLIRAGIDSVIVEESTPLKGRFALLPQRARIVRPQHIRDLLNREGF